MKRGIILAILLIGFLASCSPQIHLDFLGQEKIAEVVLIKSKAKEKILMIDVEGIISSLVNPSVFSRESDSISQVYYRLDKAAKDPWVKGIILRLDTPGGEVNASDIVCHEIIKFKEKTKRPVVGLMMSLAASGGFYIASACDYIIAHPSTITGSIGVISVFPNVGDLFSKIGVKMNVIKSGGLKDAGSAFREMSAEERGVFQKIVDGFYKKFLDVVYESRQSRITRQQLQEAADGRVFTAGQALDLKLIDEIGYFDNALQKVLSLASLKEANVVAYTYYPKTKTNIYAASLKGDFLSEKKSLENWLPSLKSGFYYLWLPEIGR